MQTFAKNGDIRKVPLTYILSTLLCLSILQCFFVDSKCMKQAASVSFRSRLTIKIKSNFRFVINVCQLELSLRKYPHEGVCTEETL